MIRWTLLRADAVIAVSGALKKAMIDLGVNSNKIHVIPNGVDAERFGLLNREEARKLLKLPVGNPLIVSVGALIRSKGHHTLIDAFAQICMRHAGLQLYILGEGPARAELESLVRKLGLEERIRLTGKRPNEELQQWFNAAEVSCLASEREGWPNVVTESLACGTPVVATGVGGIPEILRSTEFGIIVDQTADSVAQGLGDALARDWDRPTISRQARARSWAVVAGELEELFSSLIQRSKESQER
jgi:glycosyltransferase involved in cell wall biosynthesis